MTKRKTIAEFTVDVLKETRRDSLCYDDAEVLDAIGSLAGMRFLHPRERRERVLLALGKSSWFVRSYVRGASGNPVRKFTLKKSVEEKAATFADPFATRKV